MAEKCVVFGRESDFATGSAGERSGACCIQQGCSLPHGIVAGMIVASTTGATALRVCGQQSCWCADADFVFVKEEGQCNDREEAAGAMLQHIVETTINAAMILVRMKLSASEHE